MSSSTRSILTFVIGAIIVLLTIRWVFGIVLSLIWHVLPVVVVAGVLYVVYQTYGRKALGGGRRTLP